MRTQRKPIVLNVYLLYLSDPEHCDYKQFCRVKIMLHHLFRSKDLDDLFVLEDGFLQLIGNRFTRNVLHIIASIWLMC